MEELALVVDAEGDARCAAEVAGFTVVAVAQGEEALFEYGQHFFDVVLVSLHLRGMSGADVCRELRRRSRTPILVTSRGGDSAWLDALEAGADDHLRLPCEPYELRARTDAIARRWRGPLGAVRTVRLGSTQIRVANGTAELPAAWPLDPEAATLLALLCERPGVAVSRLALAERVSRRHGDLDETAIETHLDRLDRVLGQTGVGVQRTPGGAVRVAPRS